MSPRQSQDRRAALDRFTPRSAPAPATRATPAPPPEKPAPEPQTAKPTPRSSTPTKAATPPASPRPHTESADMAQLLTNSLSVPVVAKLLGLTEAALRVRISDERFPSAKAGRMRVVPAQDFDRWLAQRERDARDEAKRLSEIRRRAKSAPRALEG